MDDSLRDFAANGLSLDAFRKMSDKEQQDCLDYLMNEWESRKQGKQVFDFGGLEFATYPIPDALKK